MSRIVTAATTDTHSAELSQQQPRTHTWQVLRNQKHRDGELTSTLISTRETGKLGVRACITVVSARGKLRQEVFKESKASLGYRIKSCLKRNKQKLQDG